MSIRHMLESSERWDSLLRKCPHQTGLGVSLGDFFDG